MDSFLWFRGSNNRVTGGVCRATLSEDRKDKEVDSGHLTEGRIRKLGYVRSKGCRGEVERSFLEDFCNHGEVQDEVSGKVVHEIKMRK